MWTHSRIAKMCHCAEIAVFHAREFEGTLTRGVIGAARDTVDAVGDGCEIAQVLVAACGDFGGRGHSLEDVSLCGKDCALVDRIACVCWVEPVSCDIVSLDSCKSVLCHARRFNDVTVIVIVIAHDDRVCLI